MERGIDTETEKRAENGAGGVGEVWACTKRFEHEILLFLQQFHAFPAVSPAQAEDLRRKIRMASAPIRGTKSVEDAKNTEKQPKTQPSAPTRKEKAMHTSPAASPREPAQKAVNLRPGGKLSNSVGEYVLSFDQTLFGQYLRARNIKVDKNEAIERI